MDNYQRDKSNFIISLLQYSYMKKSSTIGLFVSLIVLVGLLFYLQSRLGYSASAQSYGISLQDNQQSTIYIDPTERWKITHPVLWDMKETSYYNEGSLFEKTEIVSNDTHTHYSPIGQPIVAREPLGTSYHSHESYTGKVIIALHKNDSSTRDTLKFIRSTYDQTIFKGNEAYSSIRSSVRDDLPHYAQHLFVIPENTDFYYVITANASDLDEDALQVTIDKIQDIISSFTID